GEAPLGTIEHLQDMPSLDFLERKSGLGIGACHLRLGSAALELRSACVVRILSESQQTCRHLELGTVCEHRRALNHVLQLAHVPRPSVARKALHARVRNTTELASEPGFELSQAARDQRWNVR